MQDVLLLAQNYDTTGDAPWFVPVISFFILLVISTRFFGGLGFWAWLITVFIYLFS